MDLGFTKEEAEYGYNKCLTIEAAVEIIVKKQAEDDADGESI